MKVDDQLEAIREKKAALRSLALARRRLLPDKVAVSRLIWQHLESLPAFEAAHVICGYMAKPEEVQTWEGLERCLKLGKRVVVPYCEGSDLGVCEIFSLQELTPGRWGILEPPSNLRREPGRIVDVAEIDLVLVPGLAFDRMGRRLGWGKGYFDRLLSRLPPRCLTVGLAFQCQVFDSLPELPHDAKVRILVTEAAVYTCG